MPRTRRMIPVASRMVIATGVLLLTTGCDLVGNNHDIRGATVYQPAADIRVVPCVVVWHGPALQDAACPFRQAAQRRAAERGIKLVWSPSNGDPHAANTTDGTDADAVAFIAPMSKAMHDAAEEALKREKPVFLVGADSREIAVTCRLEPADHNDIAGDAAPALLLVDTVADYVRGKSVPPVIKASKRALEPTGPMQNRE